MFCLLPTTSFALGAVPPAEVANASGFFNLMRNLDDPCRRWWRRWHG